MTIAPPPEALLLAIKRRRQGLPPLPVMAPVVLPVEDEALPPHLVAQAAAISREFRWGR